MSEHTSTNEATNLYQPNDFIALALGRLAATRVTPEGTEKLRSFIEFLRRRHGDAIVDRGPEAIREAFTELSERGQILRSVISFRAFVTKAERDAIFREHTRAAGAAIRR